MSDIEHLLELAAERHSHLCPRQVLGVRMGILAGYLLEMVLPQPNKRLLTIIETDGCFADGVEIATGCTVGHRTLRVEDFGKIAAVFFDTKTHTALRIAPRSDVREQARGYAPDRKRRYFAQLEGYQKMPLPELFRVDEVVLVPPVEAILSRAGVRSSCEVCDEEIINEREIRQNGQILCKACSGASYYQMTTPISVDFSWLMPESV
jgi:formylmethanofuran dehydrogenase subunit E